MTTHEDMMALAERLPRSEFIRQALTNEIASMLDELGNPQLIERIFPEGWWHADDAGLANLYDLCIRTFNQRARAAIQGGDNG